MGKENKGNKQNRIKYLWAQANNIDFVEMERVFPFVSVSC